MKLWQLNKDTVAEINKRGKKEILESEDFLINYKKEEIKEDAKSEGTFDN